MTINESGLEDSDFINRHERRRWRAIERREAKRKAKKEPRAR